MNNMSKNRMVVVVLVLMIVAAGYLNHRSQKDMDTASNTAVEGMEAGLIIPESVDPVSETAETDTMENADAGTAGSAEEETAENAEAASTEEAAEQGDTEAVSTDTAMTETAEENPGEAVFVESDAVVPEYFAEAKVERENARAKSQDILYDLMANADTPEAKKTEAADEIIKLQKRIENEAAAEAMIKAKGFENAFVRIYDESVDVIVDREELTQQEAAQIQDIVTRVTGVEAGNIRISLLKIGSSASE